MGSRATEPVGFIGEDELARLEAGVNLETIIFPYIYGERSAALYAEPIGRGEILAAFRKLDLEDLIFVFYSLRELIWEREA